MTEPPVLDAIFAQRACRWFTEAPVPNDDIERILQAAVHAPSAGNTQPWVFVVVRDADQRRHIAELARRVWHTGAREQARPRLDHRLFVDVDGSVEAGFGGAPVLIVVGGDTSRVHPRVLAASVFPAVQNLLLAAGATGYGSALTTLAAVVADELRAVLGLPSRIEPVAVIPLGRPARRLGAPRREPAFAKTHADRYGTPFG